MEMTLKKELEATKSALKMQTMRCRHLVVAFTKKLHEKEMELRASKNLRDQQLSLLLRALLILESRIKKEQKLICQQLEEKDLIIEKQEREISKYKKYGSEGMRNVSSKGKGKNGELEKIGKSNSTCGTATGEERLDNLCKELLNPPSSSFLKNLKKEGMDSSNSEYEINVKRDENNAFIDNPVLESVNQILLRDEEELLKIGKPIAINLNEKEMDGNGGDDTTEWYETNSNDVLSNEKIISNDDWNLNIIDKKDEYDSMTVKDDGGGCWINEKTSPVKSQHLEEKACLEMSKKNLTVVDLDEINNCETLKNERTISPVKSTASYEEILPISYGVNYNNKPPVHSSQKPPALPPKPARLLKPHQVLQKKNAEIQQKNFNGTPTTTTTTTTTTTNHISKSSDNLGTNVITQSSNLGHSQPKKSVVINELNETSINKRHGGGPDSKSGKSTAEGSKTNSRQTETSSKLKKNHANHSHVQSSSEIMKNSNVSSFVKQKKKGEDIMGNCRAIKIGSSVSSLITGLSRDTIVTELSSGSLNSHEDVSHVSQLVRQFEVLGKYNNNNDDDDARGENDINDMRKNFEEFKLEESYAESEENGGRHDGDGAENKNMVNYYATLTIVPPPLSKDPPPVTDLEYKMYETFLENTGLSQKSILTPSRMLSNHRSCLKPKDVKHRSRVKAAAAIEKCNMNSSNGSSSTVKYWTEPFL